MNGDSAAQRSLAAAVRQFLNQAGRLLEEQEPRSLVADNGPLLASLASWRQAVDAQTSGLSIEKARSLEGDKLKLMGEVGSLKKECADLRERNEQLRAEIVRLNQREQEFKQQVLDAEFRGGGAKAQAKTLDLEIRDLRRRIRELEGGPPLTPSEAAPRSMDKLQALFSGKSAPTVVSPLQARAGNADAATRLDIEPGPDSAQPGPEPKTATKTQEPPPPKRRPRPKAGRGPQKARAAKGKTRAAKPTAPQRKQEQKPAKRPPAKKPPGTRTPAPPPGRRKPTNPAKRAAGSAPRRKPASSAKSKEKKAK
jgi:cell division protein FtsB